MADVKKNQEPHIGDTLEDTSDSVLWSFYTKAPIPHELVDLPTSPGSKMRLIPQNMLQIAMVPISAEDTMLCQAEADDYAKKYILKAAPKEEEKNLAYENIFANERTIRVLWRACRDPNDKTLAKKVFPGPKAMRMSMTMDQIGVLAHSYIRVERLLSPIRSIMTEEEMDGFLMRLREGGRSSPLDWLSSELLRDLLLRSVLNPLPLPSPSNSSGSPQDKSTTLETQSDEPSGECAPEETPPLPTVDGEPDLKKAPDETPPALIIG